MKTLFVVLLILSSAFVGSVPVTDDSTTFSDSDAMHPPMNTILRSHLPGHFDTEAAKRFNITDSDLLLRFG
ncbi:hypothetical protein QR680_003844 [Steinernema hermaphroditum]|uniref:Uncharacterized protein n=1 Tax=Steinernema hermaphroditum TaxID=289476 RepID=A0AA39LT10_9BILA|nr:hypothetical protein QR680_003844 [Steinernema hermaphroditum]